MDQLCYARGILVIFRRLFFSLKIEMWIDPVVVVHHFKAILKKT